MKCHGKKGKVCAEPKRWRRCFRFAPDGIGRLTTRNGRKTIKRVMTVPNRARDWLRQAIHDLKQAEESRRAGRHDWACFAVQQTAEKAVKALHPHLGQEAWGHVIARLLQELPPEVTVPAELMDQARVLDNFYIPTRYPNSHAEGAPFEHYGPLQSEVALRYARAIVEFVRAQMGEP